jgi:cyanophycin synthetase
MSAYLPVEPPLQEAEPNHGFADSRRITGPNRWFAGTAVTLTPLGLCAADSAAHQRWCNHVQRLYAHLGWPPPYPQVVHSSEGVEFICAAPHDQLFTATEVGEWAWEQELAAAGDSSFDSAQPFGTSEFESLLLQRAQAERKPQLAALEAAAQSRGLSVLVDDEQVSLGSGTGSRTWPLTQVPLVNDVPWPKLHDVPTALVTGSNGKTTTVRLIAAMAQAVGLTPGLCSTEGVVVAGQPQTQGDYAGPAGARTVLRDQRVQVAVLETARGGILRRGLAVQQAHVAVVTNISADHLGEYGIESPEDIAQVKLVVARVVQHSGSLVLNADDAVLLASVANLPHAAQAQHALFAQDHNHPALLALRASGGSTCGVQDGRLLLGHQSHVHDLAAVADVPITLGGAAPYNTANAMAAVLAAVGLGLPLDALRHGLLHFGAKPADNPGRLERWRHRGATVLIDYAHNPDGLLQLLGVAQALKPRRLGLLLGQAGNRSDAAITDLAGVAARFKPDRVLIKELPLMLRGRALGEVPTLLLRALLAAGQEPSGVRYQADEHGDEKAACHALLNWAQPGDVLVLPIHTTAVREALTQWLHEQGS